jgi:hypothetical protein
MGHRWGRTKRVAKRPTHAGGVGRPLADRTTTPEDRKAPVPVTHTGLQHSALQASLLGPGLAPNASGFVRPPRQTPNGHLGIPSLPGTPSGGGADTTHRGPMNPPTGTPAGGRAPVQSGHRILPWTPFPGSGNTQNSAGGYVVPPLNQPTIKVGGD